MCVYMGGEDIRPRDSGDGGASVIVTSLPSYTDKRLSYPLPQYKKSLLLYFKILRKETGRGDMKPNFSVFVTTNNQENLLVYSSLSSGS